MKVARFSKKFLTLMILCACLQNTRCLKCYTIPEGCEIGLTATRLPLIIASKISLRSNHQKRALIIDLITHTIRSSAEILHMHNHQHDLRHHRYACIAYDVERFLISAKKLYGLKNPNDKKTATQDEAEIPQEVKKQLNILRDILLPTVESGTALYRAIDTQDDPRHCKYRLTADYCGALARSFANLIEDDQSTPEQILAIAYVIYTICFAFNDFITPTPVAVTNPPHDGGPEEHAPQIHVRRIAGTGLTQEEIDAAERQFGGWDYPRPGQASRTQNTRPPAPVITIGNDAVINTDCPLAQEPFVNGEQILRLACGHGVTGVGELLNGFNRHEHICPLCRQPRDVAREHIINVSSEFQNS